MANKEQLAILKKGADAWNKWRKENENVKIDLSGADLRGANLSLREANLFRADLRGVDLRGADLSNANLSHADLSHTDLRGANLFRADLRGANLRGADLREADLRQANLSRGTLIGANLKKASVAGTTFGCIYLSETVGLEQVQHGAPSQISTDTLEKSKGKIPLAFLRGCGLRDWEIESVKLYNPDLSNEETSNIVYRIYDLRATQAIQISPLFISYSHDDTVFVDKVDEALTEKGVRFWRDIHDMVAGKMEKQVDRAIRQNPTLLLVLSEHSLKSDWVEHEVRKARELEKDLGRDTLCPVALDESWKSSKWEEKVMEQIMKYNILDFSKWEDESVFEEKFAKLLSGLDLFYKKPE